MAIYSSTFGGWRLTGEDAKQFLKQIEEEGINPYAQETMRRIEENSGDIEHFLKFGYVNIPPKT